MAAGPDTDPQPVYFSSQMNPTQIPADHGTSLCGSVPNQWLGLLGELRHCGKAKTLTQFICCDKYWGEGLGVVKTLTSHCDTESCSFHLKITKLKIDNNPFAKGFREHGKNTRR